MTIERYIRLVAGILVLLSLALAHWVSAYFLFLALFVGTNLFQSALTNRCPLAYLLRALGVPNGDEARAQPV